MPSRHTIAPNGHELLREWLGISSSPSEALFVSIDFENHSSLWDPGRVFHGQVGIATLDMRDIVRSLYSPTHTEDLITTHNFVIGSSKYCDEVRRKFLFGKSLSISQHEMRCAIELVIDRTRGMILVGHDFSQDLRALQYLGVDTHPSVLGILDTSRIAREVLPTNTGKLSNILKKLCLPFARLHTAGNDANFTLRALLLLAVQDFMDEELHQDVQQTVGMIERIAHLKLPPQAGSKTSKQEAKAKKKKEKRLQKTRTYQSRFWSIEMQDQIRAERAAKKALQQDSHRNGSPEIEYATSASFGDQEIESPVEDSVYSLTNAPRKPRPFDMKPIGCCRCDQCLWRRFQ